jgi:hypothetical protein
MKTTTQRMGTSPDITVWQITLKLSLLAGCFMATTYCFLLTVNTIVGLI